MDYLHKRKTDIVEFVLSSHCSVVLSCAIHETIPRVTISSW
jgi:hypothetical protein